ncbi:hypothetical protein HXX76_016316 [Chlamydomonas incerta]|uniref:Uncharacterized protein n=1 Tax=Chlamydomonas incerta TaxID=51695 RepID=A0A835VQR6_CHLIN|nr:hypothetical protein HXX76_016316 [Chlamydomonas incerta]|eukprot:KAG2422039.1 hypothetical protein HXX76_016316 [Chlamydomonas incerta]
MAAQLKTSHRVQPQGYGRGMGRSIREPDQSHLPATPEELETKVKSHFQRYGAGAVQRGRGNTDATNPTITNNPVFDAGVDMEETP